MSLLLVGGPAHSTQLGVAEVTYGQQKVDEYAPCGQECLYGKGSEAISLEALYILRKIGLLQAALDNDHAEVFSNLRFFCTPNEAGGGRSGAEQCFKRYRDIQILTLMKIKNALALTKDARFQLNSNATVVAKVSQGQSGQPPSELKAPLPYVPVMKDLEARYASNPDLHQFVSQNYQQWVSELMPKPSCDEFVVFKEEPKDPADPSAGTWLVAQRTADGKLVTDDKKCKEAVTFWEEGQRRAGADIRDQYMQALENDATNPYRNRRPKLELKKSGQELSERAFHEARGIMVDAANNYKRTPRAPARAASAPTTVPTPVSQASPSPQNPALRTLRGASLVNEVTIGATPDQRAAGNDPQSKDATKQVQPRPAVAGQPNEGLYIIYNPDSLGQEILDLQRDAGQ